MGTLTGRAQLLDCGTRIKTEAQGEGRRFCFYWERADRFPVTRTPSLLTLARKKCVKKLALKRIDEKPKPASTPPATVRQTSCLSTVAKQMRDLCDLCETDIY